MSPEAAESNLLRQNDVYRVLRLVLTHAARVSQQVHPLLSHKLPVLGISQPRFASAQKHNAHCASNDQAGEQGQHAKADQLTVGDEHARRVDRPLECDFEPVPFRWA